eukprot:1139903-Ditylum_brightwellii.AAC.1
MSASTPTKKKCLGKNQDRKDANGYFVYRSVVGMILYLCNNDRSETQVAVSQCARFSNTPKKPHKAALKRIGCYFNGLGKKE